MKQNYDFDPADSRPLFNLRPVICPIEGSNVQWKLAKVLLCEKLHTCMNACRIKD